MAERTLLAVSAVPVFPGHDGYALRVRGLLEALSERWRIVLLAPPDGESAPATPLPPNVLRRAFPADAGIGSVLAPSETAQAVLRRITNALTVEFPPQAVILFSGSEFLGPYMVSSPAVVVDRIDCQTLTIWRNVRRGVSRNPLAGIRDLLAAFRYERRIVRGFPAIVVVGADDARWLRRIGGRDTVHVIPNGVHVPPLATTPTEAPAPTVTFTGVLAFGPNAEAARHLALDIWPKVRAAIGSAELVIAGHAPGADVRSLASIPGVRVEPDVPDIRAVLEKSWVCVAPMRTGSGIKNKVLEAWALGKPAVLSSLAANGLAMDERTQRYVTDDPQEFADRIVALLRSPVERRTLGEASQRLASSSHGWSMAAERFDALLQRVTARQGPSRSA